MQSVSKPLSRALLCFCALGIGAVTTTPAMARSIMGWIELKPIPSRNLVQITGHAIALEDATDIDFALVITRKAAGNASNTRQAGRFSAKPGDDKILSTTAINANAGDDLVVELMLVDHGKAVFKAALSWQP